MNKLGLRAHRGCEDFKYKINVVDTKLAQMSNFFCIIKIAMWFQWLQLETYVVFTRMHLQRRQTFLSHTLLSVKGILVQILDFSSN